MHELLERYSRQVWHEAVARDDERARLVSIVLRKRALASAGSLLSSVERRLAMLTDTNASGNPRCLSGSTKTKIRLTTMRRPWILACQAWATFSSNDSG